MQTHSDLILLIVYEKQKILIRISRPSLRPSGGFSRAPTERAVKTSSKSQVSYIISSLRAWEDSPSGRSPRRGLGKAPEDQGGSGGLPLKSIEY